jgi:hypothetical protein
LAAAGIGFTVKSGWAAAVLLTGSRGSPVVVDSRTIQLSNPAIPDARQPYHAGFGTARQSGRELKRLVDSVKKFGGKSVTSVIEQYQTKGHHLAGAGLVVGSTIDPDRIANDHIRIHALEGRLFRTVIEDEATRRGLQCTIWRERDLYSLAARALRQPEEKVRSAIGGLGRTLDGPWRAEQKAAALAAWLIVAQSS